MKYVFVIIVPFWVAGCVTVDGNVDYEEIATPVNSTNTFPIDLKDDAPLGKQVSENDKEIGINLTKEEKLEIKEVMAGTLHFGLYALENCYFSSDYLGDIDSSASKLKLVKIVNDIMIRWAVLEGYQIFSSDISDVDYASWHRELKNAFFEDMELIETPTIELIKVRLSSASGEYKEKICNTILESIENQYSALTNQ